MTVGSEGKKINQDILFERLSRVGYLIWQPFVEISYGFRSSGIPLGWCLLPGCIFNICSALSVDRWIFSKLGLGGLFPTTPISYYGYCLCFGASGFLCWGLYQTGLRQKLIKRLTEVFQEAGLKSPLGKLPNFIFDLPVDEFTRRLRLKRSNLSKKQFEGAKGALESALQVYIDEFQESREGGTIDILYSHFPMPETTNINDVISSLEKNSFVIGSTRSKQLTVNLREVPHFLVGGQTGGGKSTFLRQMIASLYLNNDSFEFVLIDLKGGLEFQLFEKLPRVQVIPSMRTAVHQITKLDKIIESRMSLLRFNGCKDIEEFFALPSAARRYPNDYEKTSLGRMILVVDEAAELFMVSPGSKSKEVQMARKTMWKVAAQGRAIGIHLVIATQKPDVNALDSQVKSNLPGVVSFQMANHASSFTVLGNSRAAQLPQIPGRAIWKCGLEMVEVQTPLLTTEEVRNLIKDLIDEKKSMITEETVNEEEALETTIN